MTLRQLIAAHPEWLDHTMVVYTDALGHERVCDFKVDPKEMGSASVYEYTEPEDEEHDPETAVVGPGEKCIVFSGN